MNAPLSFLALSDIPDCRQVYDRRVVGYGTIQLTSGAPLRVAYDETWFELDDSPFAWPAYQGPRLRFHAAHEGAHWHHRHLAFAGPRLGDWENSGLWPFRPHRVPDEWLDLFPQIQALSQEGGIAALRVTNTIERLLIDIATEQKESLTVRPEWLRGVIGDLTAEYMPDYAVIAAKWGMGESTLRRRFRHAMGIPLHEFVIQHRISEARRMLVESNDPLAKIADELGYGSEFFFARQFKQWTGVTPGVYRRSR